MIADRYRLEKEIGSGGMATVWEATHLKLNRSVAIKLIDVAGPQSQRLTERFLREARVLAAIRHRNVVDIIDFGTTEHGRPYMAMELLVGRPLSRSLDDGVRMPVGEVVRIMARVLSGLAAVHDVGIVHRDLKPENIFLVEDADGVYPKLLDFGVSRALDPRADLESVMPTQENAIVGTPQYMSPEQARVLKDLDQRSDLWSAGVILYELLSGRLPFDAEAVGDIIIKIATEEPPPLSQVRPELAGPLNVVVMRALRRDPDDRFEDAREMRAALLAAAAKEAELLDGSGRDRVRVETHSDMPPPGADEIRSALTDAYEPGDSNLIDFSDHSELRRRDLGPIEPKLPPPPRRPTVDPFEVDMEVDEPEAPRRGRGWAIAILLMGLGAAGAAYYYWLGRPPSAPPAPELTAGPLVEEPLVEEPATEEEPASVEPLPAPDDELGWDEAGPPPEDEAADEATGDEEALEEPRTVTISLEGLPRTAVVEIDGERVEDPSVIEVEAGAEHEIEARAPGRRTWRMTHSGQEDATYRVRMARQRRARGRARRAEPDETTSRGMIRDPGF